MQIWSHTTCKHGSTNWKTRDLPRCVHHGESGHDVRAGAIAETEDVFDPELVENSDKILTKMLDGGEGTVIQIAGVSLVPGHVHVNEDGALLDFLEGGRVDEFLRKNTVTRPFLSPSVRLEVEGLSELLLRHFSDILIFWKIFKVNKAQILTF